MCFQKILTFRSRTNKNTESRTDYSLNFSVKKLPIDRKSSHRNPDKKAVSTNVKIRTKNQINHVMYFSHLVRNPDKKDFMTRATVSVTAFSGQNSGPPVYLIRKDFKMT